MDKKENTHQHPHHINLPMALSINAAVFASNCDENESPQVFSKRKSASISPSCGHPVAVTSSSTTAATIHRGPLSDLHPTSKVEKAMTIAVAAPAACAGPSARPSLPAAAANKSTVRTYNKFKSLQLSKEEIEATDEKQASVNQLSGWLANEAAKKNKKPSIHRPQAATSSNQHPMRFQAKPRIKKEDVEATDSKRVSVKTLSSWMSDDPFEQKKVRTVRTGSNVIAKSRVFEKEKEMRADRQCDIRAGSVEERSAWLSGAFKHEGDENGVAVTSAQEKKVVRPYQAKPKRDEKPSDENELMSVSDKKEWFSKAFKKGGEGTAIQETNSFEEHHHPRGGATPAIHLTKSFETKHDNPAPGKTESATADDMCVPTINQAKSFDGIRRQPTLNSFQKDVVRLYQKDGGDDEARPDAALKSVHDKQAWLSSAFKKPMGSVVGSHHGTTAVAKDIFRKQPNPVGEQMIHTVDSDKDSIMDGAADPPSATKLMTNDKSHAPGVDDIDKMSVADRAKWLQGAFKK
jgi:hypothetical protein